LDKFLDLYNSVSTRNTYKYGLTKFFDFIYSENLELKDKVEKYFQEKRDIQSDIQTFNASIADLPPKSSHLYVSSVKNFLMENNVELPKRFWRHLRDRRKGSKARILDIVPSNKELKRILTHMDINGKALFLLLASSGMRIGEALKLKPEDLDLEKNTVEIKGENTKTGNPRIAFFSSECKEILKEWISQKETYLHQKEGRTREEYENKRLEDRLFPYTIYNAYEIWRRALKKTGNGERDKSTKRYKVHPHVLRKFFRTQMGKVIPVDIAEALMGHEGYLTEVYRKYTREDLAEFYKQGEHAVSVMGMDTEEISKIKVEIDERNRQLQTLVNGLVTENMEIKAKMNQVETEITDLKKTNSEIKKTLEKLVS
jgi:integrase